MGSSRPQLLAFTWESFEKFVMYRKKLKVLFHEDCLFPGMSNDSIEYANSKGFQVTESKPNIGLGLAMDLMFKKTKAEYVLYLQDDWEFELPVDLDRILHIMDNHQEINCVTFNKYRNMKKLDGFEDKEYIFDNQRFCIYGGWQFLPGVWRMSKVREKWRVREIRPEGYFQNSFGTHNQRLNHEFLEKNVGAYMLGGMGQYRYVRHIGNTWRMADWRMKHGKPGGTLHWEFMNIKRDRAPWLGEMPERPMNHDIKLNSEGQKFLEGQEKYIKERYNG